MSRSCSTSVVRPSPTAPMALSEPQLNGYSNGSIANQCNVQNVHDNVPSDVSASMRPRMSYDNLLQYCQQLQSANNSLLESNNNLKQEKQNLSSTIQQLHGYVEAQRQQISKLQYTIANSSVPMPQQQPAYTNEPCGCCVCTQNSNQSVMQFCDAQSAQREMYNSTPYSSVTPCYL